MPKTQTAKRKKKTTPQVRARREAADVRRQQKKRRRRITYIVIASVVAVLIITSFSLPEIFQAINRGNPLPPAEAPGVRVPLMADTSHIPTGAVFANYNSVPPTSGPHYDKEANWGVFATELLDEQIVHNLEHAGVVISYNLKDQAQIDQLKGIVESYPRFCYLVMRPYSKVGEGEVALTAWGALYRMTGVNETEVRRFIDYYRGNGGPGRNAPELPPC